MKKLFILCFLSITVISLLSCKKDINGPNNNGFNVHPENLVAVTGYFEKNGVHSTHIVLVDFYNLKNYKIITDTTMRAVEPRFSNDKRKIVFGDYYHYAFDAGAGLVLYDLMNDTFLPLYYRIVSDVPPVWNYDDTGIYYNVYMGGLLFYLFSIQASESLHGGQDFLPYWPVGLKGQDTIIVFAYKDGKPGFYLADLNGNYLSTINNPYFELIQVNSVTKKGVTNLNWNDKYGLFVYSEIDSSVDGRKISVTNLDGSYYRSYTSGDYNDDHPVWGPESRYILFERKHKSPLGYRIMLIDRETGTVQDFLKPGDIPGSLGFRYPDY